MKRKCVPTDDNVLSRKHLSLYRLQKASPEMTGTKLFTASKGWLHRFWNRFRIKNIKIIGEPYSDSFY